MNSASVDHVTPAAISLCFEQGQTNGANFKAAYQLGREEMQAAILELIRVAIASDAILYNGEEMLNNLRESIEGTDGVTG